MGMNLRKTAAAVLCLMLGVSSLGGCAGNDHPQEKKPNYPEKPVEVVVNTDPGDGVYMFASAISEALSKQQGIRFNVVSKTGGSGANQMAYVATKKGDPYYLSTCQPSTITTPIKNDLELTYRDFTPICCVIAEPYLYVVRADSPFQSFEDLVAYAKEHPKELIQGTGVYGANDTVLSTLVQSKTGTEFNIVPFSDGGQMLIAVLSGDADFISANPSELMEQIEAGKLRPLAIASEDRLEGLPDVPTLKEQGIDVVFQGFRGIMAPADVEPEVVLWLEQAIKEASEEPDFEKYLKENLVDRVWMDHQELAGYWEELDAMYHEIYEQMGI